MAQLQFARSSTQSWDLSENTPAAPVWAPQGWGAGSSSSPCTAGCAETRSQGISAALKMQLSWQSWLFLLMRSPQNLCSKEE